jgi:hypothetical protein
MGIITIGKQVREILIEAYHDGCSRTGIKLMRMLDAPLARRFRGCQAAVHPLYKEICQLCKVLCRQRRHGGHAAVSSIAQRLKCPLSAFSQIIVVLIESIENTHPRHRLKPPAVNLFVGIG